MINIYGMTVTHSKEIATVVPHSGNSQWEFPDSTECIIGYLEAQADLGTSMLCDFV